MSKYKNFLERERDEVEAKRREARMKSKFNTPKKDRMEAKFETLMSMSEEDMAKRLTEIQERRKIISKELEGRKQKGTEIQRKSIRKLTEEDAKLKKEQTIIENFKKSKTKIIKIRQIRDSAIKKRERNKASLKDKIQENNKAISEAKAEQEKLGKDKAAREKELRGISEKLTQIAKLDKALESKETLHEEDEKQLIANLHEKRKLLARQRELRKLQKEDSQKYYIKTIEDLEKKGADLRKQSEEYETENSKEEGIINSCNMAWKMLLVGKTWDEIILASIEEVQRRQAKEQQAKETQEQQVEPEQTEVVPEEQQVEPEQTKVAQEKQGIEFEEGINPEELPAIKSKWYMKIPFIAKIVHAISERRKEKADNKLVDYGYGYHPIKITSKQRDEVEKSKNSFERSVSKAKNENKLGNLTEVLVSSDEIDFIKDEVEEPTTVKETEKSPDVAEVENEKQAKNAKEARALFMKYLRDAVEEGHTEQGKYSTQDGLKDKEMRDRIDVRTQKEAERRANGIDKTENKEQQANDHEGMQLGD